MKEPLYAILKVVFYWRYKNMSEKDGPSWRTGIANIKTGINVSSNVSLPTFTMHRMSLSSLSFDFGDLKCSNSRINVRFVDFDLLLALILDFFVSAIWRAFKASLAFLWGFISVWNYEWIYQYVEYILVNTVRKWSPKLKKCQGQIKHQTLGALRGIQTKSSWICCLLCLAFEGYKIYLFRLCWFRICFHKIPFQQDRLLSVIFSFWSSAFDQKIARFGSKDRLLWLERSSAKITNFRKKII